ncbi:polysaccharide deacetylase family protein [Xylophilus sp.]|uniref:polysaccharide deacetylase family protein n=1 Tax=Xylophilus sp. TaxID=2653893 RepID=UPI0013BE08F3|nr:polysaccharide deacetylase family protein [Xylophilus sp.]KAF1045990.1 MAG: hypothetical protein GAK38_02693 [Xylophilus sp.]
MTAAPSSREPAAPGGLGLRASRWLARRAVRRRLPLRGGVGVVSFTFDDALLSACTEGAAVLERRGVRGTYYVAGGLTGAQELGRACHTAAALRDLLAAGHELGGHSFAHVRCDRLPAARLREEFDRSDDFLRGLGLPPGPLDFAYPFGAYAWQVKRLCGERFRSSRATGGGTQVGWADLDALRTHRLYLAEPDGVGYAQRVREAARAGGWLVVNTHEVEDGAGPYGCTPAALDAAVALAQDLGCRVLPVAAALEHWTRQA